MKKSWQDIISESFLLRTAGIVALILIVICDLILCFRGCTKKTAVVDTPPIALETAEPAAPTPRPIPVATLSFTENTEFPLPQKEKTLSQGAFFRLRGTVQSNYPLTSVTVTITCDHNDKEIYPYKKTVSFFPADFLQSYPLDSTGTKSGKSLDDLVKFSELQVGLHTMTLSATIAGHTKSYPLATTQFYVLGEKWKWIQKNDFNNSYDAALKFFSVPERFVYRYQWVDGRYIVADPEWEKTYITKIQGLPGDSLWSVHIDAVPYYEKALGYLHNTYVRVRGTNGDSGIIPLSDLVVEYNGSYVSRFTSSLKTISHHAFGTATDINASMKPNKNLAENNAVIYDEVKNYLSYTGIVTEDDVQYYDYTYSGSYPTQHRGVPDSVINYLLYELAFFRAGFQWGHYYISTSDAMHFTLSDNVLGTHEDETGLRKVFDYIDN